MNENVNGNVNGNVNENGLRDLLPDERRMAVLLAAVHRLPEPHQDVLTLWVWEGLGYDEIAVALGLRVGTVKSRLSRARTRLQALEAIEIAVAPEPTEGSAGRTAEGTAPSPRASTVEPPHGAAPARPADGERGGWP